MYVLCVVPCTHTREDKFHILSDPILCHTVSSLRKPLSGIAQYLDSLTDYTSYCSVSCGSSGVKHPIAFYQVYSKSPLYADTVYVSVISWRWCLGTKSNFGSTISHDVSFKQIWCHAYEWHFPSCVLSYNTVYSHMWICYFNDSFWYHILFNKKDCFLLPRDDV